MKELIANIMADNDLSNDDKKKLLEDFLSKYETKLMTSGPIDSNELVQHNENIQSIKDALQKVGGKQ